ncbi:MAG: hypothetical protein ACTSRW_16855, partial [Candidatus Helarchaeota archaeon]
MDDIKQAEWEDFVDDLSDEDIHKIAAQAAGWSSGTRINDELIDEDGFAVSGSLNTYQHSFKELQKQCWQHAQENPHINSHVRDFTGTLTGSGFATDCNVKEISDVIKDISNDIRNELPLKMPKYVARSEIQGELFLMLTCHKNGFIEIDFQEPLSLSGGPEDEGIYHHPTKKTMPVFYQFSDGENAEGDYIVPSAYVAHAPQLADDTIKANKISTALLKDSKGTGYDKLGGYKRFIVSWDRSFLTVRNVSHIKTTIEWVNHYVNLKKWEIDHKKSSGSYLWVVSMEDPKAFRTWLKMTDAEKSQTGLTSKKTPGGTLILPPGVKLSCENPKLASISDQDNDILHLITAGLNRPEDMVTGQTSGDTFSGVKASRGPAADRISDEITYFERFLRFTFWRTIFFLRSKTTSFKNEYKVREVVSFKNKKPITKTVTKKAYELVDFDFPTSEVSDIEAKTKAYLGVNHQSLAETLGIPNADIAKRLGFSNYPKRRLLYETDKETYP